MCVAYHRVVLDTGGHGLSGVSWGLRRREETDSTDRFAIRWDPPMITSSLAGVDRSGVMNIPRVRVGKTAYLKASPQQLG